MSALKAVPETSPAWWLHWSNVAIAVASFVGVAIHPGWHPPSVLVDTIGPLAVVLAVASGVAFGVLEHGASKANLLAAYRYVEAHAGELTAAAAALAPLVDRYPAVETRLSALEALPHVSTSGHTVAELLQALTAATVKDPPPA
jgi:hypothetical protein